MGKAHKEKNKVVRTVDGRWCITELQTGTAAATSNVCHLGANGAAPFGISKTRLN